MKGRNSRICKLIAGARLTFRSSSLFEISDAVAYPAVDQRRTLVDDGERLYTSIYVYVHVCTYTR